MQGARTARSRSPSFVPEPVPEPVPDPAILPVLQHLVLVDEPRHNSGLELLLRIVGMQVQMVRRTRESGTGSGTGSGT